MSSHVPFTDNVQDLSTDKGFQFKFCCERCGNGYMSSFQYNALSVAGGALQVASGLFGGVFGRAASSAYDVQRLVGGPAHDAAMRQAVSEVSPEFNQCNRCGQWVCRSICWNGQRHQCVSCSPKMDQELAAIESDGTIHQLRRQTYDGSVDLTGGSRSILPPPVSSRWQPPTSPVPVAPMLRAARSSVPNADRKWLSSSPAPAAVSNRLRALSSAPNVASGSIPKAA
jgi:hypothetical protein